MKLTLIFLLISSIVYCQDIVNDIGRYHNNGLAYGKQTLTGKPLSGGLALSTAHEYLVSTNLAESADLDLTNANLIENLMRSPNNSFRSAIEFSEQKVGTSSLPSYFSEMKAIEQTLSKSRTGSKASIVSNIKSELLGHKSRTRNAEAIALINLALFSADFWNGEPTVPGENTSVWIQLDAAGYLIGWSLAFHEDVITDKDSGPNARMRKGLYAAITASMRPFMKI